MYHILRDRNLAHPARCSDVLGLRTSSPVGDLTARRCSRDRKALMKITLPTKSILRNEPISPLAITGLRDHPLKSVQSV
jgi:hypothetical protein